METYTFMRQLADSWVLLAMFIFFIGAGIWAFLPRNRASGIEAAEIPFRTDDKACAKNCELCSCRFAFHEEPTNG